MKRFALILATAAVLAAGAAPAAFAQDLGSNAVFQATTLNLSAFGETKVAPDLATITLGVSVQEPTASAAMAANRTRMNAAVAALKAQGIAEKDIQTSGLNLSPQYVYEANKPQRLTGYQANNDVTITVRDIARLGSVIDAVVAAGSNQINGIGFGVANPRAAEDAARKAAVQALSAKAALYAEATGMRLSRLVNLSEAGGYAPQPPQPMFKVMAMRADSAPTPIQAGELSVRVDVSAIYELAK